MDESVLRAMARWPDVPDVFGWLALDRRGRWLLKGETIGNRAAVAFINRNYAADELGRWYFQNGPQRVYAELHYTPWVLRLESDGRFTTHTGQDAGTPRAAFVDENGAVLLDVPCGAGLLDDRDLDAFSLLLRASDDAALDDDATAARLERAASGEPMHLDVRLGGEPRPLEFLTSTCVPARFGFVPCPVADQNA